MEERKLYISDGLIEAGCDEAGRGCLAGPVVAAAVILPEDFDPNWVADSKKLTARQRDEAAVLVREKALAWAVAVVDNEEIDRINILKASFLAMHKAVDQLLLRPQLLVIDGNRFYSYPGIPHECIVEGDDKVASISAASILAKTHRDALMDQLHIEYPQYGWIRNKGYGTPYHHQAIRDFGITPYHRRSYAPVSEYIQMNMFSENEGEASSSNFE